MFHTKSPLMALYFAAYVRDSTLEKLFEDSLCSEANYICPITAWPVAAVGLRLNESCVTHLSPISPMQMPDMCGSAGPKAETVF